MDIDDEAKRVTRQEANEIFRQYVKERNERFTAEAIALGFSSQEEKRQHDWDEWERRTIEAERLLPERAAAAGMTVDEYHRYIFSNKRLKSPSPMPSFSQCDCEEHPNPWFCPGLLVDYHSQDEPDFQKIEERNRALIETLTIEPEEKSRRLDPKTLERAWDMIGPTTTLPLPIWARAQPEFLAMPRIHETNSPRRNTSSLVVSASLDGDSDLSTSVATTPHSPTRELEHNTRPKRFKRSRQPSRRRASLSAHEKRHITKIAKHTGYPAGGTRSHKLPLFYELDCNGHLKSSSDCQETKRKGKAEKQEIERLRKGETENDSRKRKSTDLNREIH